MTVTSSYGEAKQVVPAFQNILMRDYSFWQHIFYEGSLYE